MFDITDQKVVLRLQGDRCRPARRFGKVNRLGHVPAQKIGKAVMRNFAKGYRIIKKSQTFLQRGQRVPAMKLVKVDLINPKPGQRPVQRPHQMPPRIAKVIWPVTHRKPTLGCDYQMLCVGGMPCQPTPDDAFR